MVKLLTKRTHPLVAAHVKHQTPREQLGIVFDVVQLSRTLIDGLTFVDSVPKRDPSLIKKAFMRDYAKSMSIGKFVRDNFTIAETPLAPPAKTADAPVVSLDEYIKFMWKQLTRQADVPLEHSSLIALPNPYVVPGGRFRSIYYWDSYFTMLGLREHGEVTLLEGMVKNFAYLIETVGYIPNGNRTYYLGRSQPPYFALMVEMLAEVKGNEVYETYLPAMVKEYAYWMHGAKSAAFVRKQTNASLHVVRMPDGELLNRFWDTEGTPREESFAEDTELSRHTEDAAQFYRDMRAGAESGWDYTSRWFADGKTRETVRTTDIVPVDLNSILYMTEEIIAKAYAAGGMDDEAERFTARAGLRAHAIETYLWNEEQGYFMDYILSDKVQSPALSIAGVTPLFAGIASNEQAQKAKDTCMRLFLRPGGVVSTLTETGEQWDAPNGWAPLQYIAITALSNYGFHDEAKEIANRWCRLVIAEYKRTGTLMEKYDVEHPGRLGGGGEYPVQDGFGWTNGVQVTLMHRYGIEE